MQKIKFSKDNGNAFYKELKENINAHFKEHNIQKTGNQTTYYENGNTKETQSINKNYQLVKQKQFTSKGILYKQSTFNYQEDPNFVDKLIKLSSITTYDTTTKKKKEVHEYYDKQKHGLESYYYSNGKPKSISNYKFNKKFGEETTYFENGKIASKTIYQSDKKQGLGETFYDNGKLHTSTNYRNNRKEGLFKSYYLNSELEVEGNYLRNEKHGLWKFYNEDGRKSKTEKYNKGKLIKKKWVL